MSSPYPNTRSGRAAPPPGFKYPPRKACPQCGLVCSNLVPCIANPHAACLKGVCQGCLEWAHWTSRNGSKRIILACKPCLQLYGRYMGH